MNISYNWLKEYLQFDLSPRETADALTDIGLEAEGVEEIQFSSMMSAVSFLLGRVALTSRATWSINSRALQLDSVMKCCIWK